MELLSAIDEFILDRESLGRASNTIKFYRSNLRRTADYMNEIGITAVDGLNRSTLRQFFANLNRQELSEYTVSAYDRALRAFFAFCQTERWIDESPMHYRPRIRPARELPDTWTLDEIVEILATCQDDVPGVRDRASLLLLLDTGIRAGEFASLRIDGVECGSDRGQVHVRADGSKSDQARTVHFWAKTAESLRAWLEIRPAAKTLFVALDGIKRPQMEPFTSGGLYQMVRRRVDQAGIARKKSLCHIWRHTFAKNYVLAGGDLETLRRLLGHTSLETVRIYLGFRTDEVAARHFELSPVRRLFEHASGQ